MDYRTDMGYLLKFKDQYFELQEDVERLLDSLSGANAPTTSGGRTVPTTGRNRLEAVVDPGEKALLESYRQIACRLPAKDSIADRKAMRRLFDRGFYRTQTGVRLFPRRHYFRKGAARGFRPHPLFDPAHYISANRLEGLVAEPFRHFMRVGGRAGLSPHPLFDARWYLARYPDVTAVGMNPLLHYCLHGHTEGRDPSPGFSTRRYLDAYEDVRRSGMNPLVHFVLHGEREGRKAFG